MNYKKYLHKIIAFGLLLMGTSSCKRPVLVKKSVHVKQVRLPIHTAEQSSATPMITIWIHGTRLLKQLVHPLDAYMHAAPLGVHKATQLPHNYRLKALAQALHMVDHTRFPLETFYVFGWPGDLSFKAREDAARDLYTAIQQLKHEYTATHGISPHIRLITHSHGGNVVLNLAKVHDPHDDLRIAQVVLLANPIQKETSALANGPLFEKIYALYSTLDNMQILDPQGMYKTEHNSNRHLKFSGRRLAPQANLRQAKIKINGHGIPHIGFITRGFINYLPTILDTLDTWEQENPTLPNQERILTLHT